MDNAFIYATTAVLGHVGFIFTPVGAFVHFAAKSFVLTTHFVGDDVV